MGVGNDLGAVLYCSNGYGTVCPDKIQSRDAMRRSHKQ